METGPQREGDNLHIRIQGFSEPRGGKARLLLLVEGRAALRSGGTGVLGLADRMLRHLLELVQRLRESW